MVTHDPRAATIADRILFLADGLIVRDLAKSSQEVILSAMSELDCVTKFALKGLLGRKLRTALTAIAIVLGVAMISGTYVLTDSINCGVQLDLHRSRARARTPSSAASPRSISARTATTPKPPFDESLAAQGPRPARGRRRPSRA